jgi:hypothetical protein
MFIEVDDLGALLKAKQNVEVGRSAAAERDCVFDMVGDASALLIVSKSNMDRERLFAEDRLVGSGCRDEVLEIDGVALSRRAAFADHDDIEGDLQGVGCRLAFEVRFAQNPVERDIIRTPLRAGAEDRRI